MAGMSAYLARKILSENFSGKTLYYALFTEDPTDNNDTSKEVSADWYERRTVTFGQPQDDTDNVYVTNTTPILFPRTISAPITFVAWGVYDAQSAGNLLGYELFPHPGHAPTVGATVGVDIDQLRFRAK